MADIMNQDSSSSWLRLTTFTSDDASAIKDQMTNQFEQVRKLVQTWHKVKAPKDSEISFDTMAKWLEESISDRYYWDRLNVVNDPRSIWLESKEDLIFFNMTWGVYDQG